MPQRRKDTIEKGDQSEWGRRIAATKARHAQEQIERGYDTETAPMFAQPLELPPPVELPAPEREEPTPNLPSTVAEAEAKLTLAWKRHEQLVDSGIDPKNPRVGFSERALLDELYAYERLADPAYYEQMVKEGRR